MSDQIEKIGNGTLIQHGKHNNRIYVLKLDKSDTKSVLAELTSLASKYKYTKIFCKIPKSSAPLFTANGFMLEAFIPKFYKCSEDVFFMSKFLSSDRLLGIETDQLYKMHDLLESEIKPKDLSVEAVSEYTFRKLNEDDAEAITELYEEVFESYPFPIHDKAYIKETMNNDVHYFGAVINGKLAAISSSEIDFSSSNAEMTDFATNKEHTGKNLSVHLLQMMEKEMKQLNIATIYTIARLNSIPMNKTFLRNGYHYSGTLIKNTNIAGSIESMNVLYKHI